MKKYLFVMFLIAISTIGYSQRPEIDTVTITLFKNFDKISQDSLTRMRLRRPRSMTMPIQSDSVALPSTPILSYNDYTELKNDLVLLVPEPYIKIITDWMDARIIVRMNEYNQARKKRTKKPKIK